LSILLAPHIANRLIGVEYLLDPQQSSRHLFDADILTTPDKLGVIAWVIVDLNYYFSRYVLMIADSHIYIGCVASLSVGGAVSGNFVGNDIEGVSCIESDVLILWGVVNTILSDKLKRAIFLISLENPHSSFRKRNPQLIVLIVRDINFVMSFEVDLTVAS
jgi:hypothetical protein